jgi:hypothetical protein
VGLEGWGHREGSGTQCPPTPEARMTSVWKKTARVLLFRPSHTGPMW